MLGHARRTIPMLVLVMLASSCAFVVRSTVSTAGGDPDGGSSEPVLSEDGRFMVFTSAASNLVGGDTNGQTDIFVRDHVAGTTELISWDVNGGPSDGFSDSPDITPDGRFVVFMSFAGDLVAGDTNGVPDVFIHDRDTGTTELVSVDSSEVPGTAGALEPSVSDTGRYVAFTTFDGFDATDTNGDFDVYLRDRTFGLTRLMSTNTANNAAAGGSYNPVVSGDGSAVAFTSTSDDVVAGDANGHADVFWRTTVLLIKLRVSEPNGGGDSDGPSQAPAISRVGDFVVYDSSATNLVAGGTSGETHVFRWDLNEIINNVQNVLVSQRSDGTEGDGRSFGAQVSADGDDVVYVTDAANLQEPGATPADSNGERDLYHWNDGANVLASQTSFGAATNDRTFFGSISDDGTALAFATDATALGFTDGNGTTDIVARPTFIPTIDSVSGSWNVGQTSTLVFTGTFGPSPVVLVGGDGVLSQTITASSPTSLTVDVTTEASAPPGNRTIWITEPAPQLGIAVPLGAADDVIHPLDP